MFVLEYWSVFVIFGFPEFQKKKELNKRNDLDLRISKKNLRIFVLSELQENQKQSYRASEMFSGRHLVKSRTLEVIFIEIKNVPLKM